MSISAHGVYTWLLPPEVLNEKGFASSSAPRWKKEGLIASNAATRALGCLVVTKPAVLETLVGNTLGPSWKIARWSCEQHRESLWISYMNVEYTNNWIEV